MRKLTLRQRVVARVKGVTGLAGAITANATMTGAVVVCVLIVMGRRAFFVDIPHHDHRDPHYAHH